MGKFKFERRDSKHTYKELVDRYVSDGALEHLRSVDDVIRHLNYWKERLGSYALVHLTPERLSKERQLLIDTPTDKNTKRSPATVNRYIATLSSSLTYGCRQLRGIDENPCFNLCTAPKRKGLPLKLKQKV